MYKRIPTWLTMLPLTAALMAWASPASAQCGPDGCSGGGDGGPPGSGGSSGSCDEFTPEVRDCGPDGGGSGGSGDPIPIQTRMDIAAFRAANALSSRPACFDALSPDGNRQDGVLNPLTVLRLVPRRNNPYAPGPRTVASVLKVDAARGTAASSIEVHDAFSSFAYDQFLFDFLAIRLTRPVTIEDMQILAILHEIGHLTGVLPAESELGPLPPDFPQGFRQVGQVFNTEILVHCLGAAEFED